MSVANQGRLDGLLVEVYDGRFGGTFEMDTEVGESIAYDDVVTFLVVAVAGKSNFGANKSGDLKRTNVFDVSEVSIIPNELATKVANQLNAFVPGLNAGQLSLGADPFASFDDDDDDDDEDEDTLLADPADPDDFSYLDDDEWDRTGVDKMEQKLAESIEALEAHQNKIPTSEAKLPDYYDEGGWN